MKTLAEKNRFFLTITGLAVLYIIVFFPVWKSLVQAWQSSEEYSHGFLILPISAYIIWKKRETLRAIPARGSRLGIPLILISLFLYVFGFYGEIATLSSLSLLFCLISIVLFLFGFPILKELSFPLAVLFFMIPVPAQIYSALTIPLQLFVSKISVDGLQLLGISIYREGNVIHLADQKFQVVQACSGLRSMASLLVLSAVFGYLTLRSNPLRFVLFLTGIPASILVNVFRVVLMILAYHFFHFDLTEDPVHTVFGVAIFFLAIVIIAAAKGALEIWDRSDTKK